MYECDGVTASICQGELFYYELYSAFRKKTKQNCAASLIYMLHKDYRWRLMVSLL